MESAELSIRYKPANDSTIKIHVYWIIYRKETVLPPSARGHTSRVCHQPLPFLVYFRSICSPPHTRTTGRQFVLHTKRTPCGSSLLSLPTTCDPSPHPPPSVPWTLVVRRRHGSVRVVCGASPRGRCRRRRPGRRKSWDASFHAASYPGGGSTAERAAAETEGPKKRRQEERRRRRRSGRRG